MSHLVILGIRPSGYGPSGFNKAQSLQNLSRPRRVETEEVPVEHLIEKENLIASQTDTIQVRMCTVLSIRLHLDLLAIKAPTLHLLFHSCLQCTTDFTNHHVHVNVVIITLQKCTS